MKDADFNKALNCKVHTAKRAINLNRILKGMCLPHRVDSFWKILKYCMGEQSVGRKSDITVVVVFFFF